MLILTRRFGESLIIGDKEAVITVLGVKGNQVRIGVAADSNVVIDREEIYLRKQHERQQLECDDSKNVKNRSALKRFAQSITRAR